MIRELKIILTASLLVLLTCNGVFSQGLPGSDTRYEEEAFSLSLEADISLITAGAALLAADLLIEPAAGPQQNEDELFFLDKISINPYNQDLDFACDILFGVSLLLPAAALIEADFTGRVEVGLMFFETMLLTYATKEVVKALVPRYRPYTYLSAPVDDDYMNSFPSGHTAMAFAVSGFSSFVFLEMYPDSEWGIPVVIGAYSIAAATGILRIASGNHFITDVIAGALIGSVYGFGVPMLHQLSLKQQTGISVEASFAGEPALTVSYHL